MSSGRRSDHLSPFDEMLANNRKKLDSLYDGPAKGLFERPSTPEYGTARATPQEPSTRPPSPTGDTLETEATRHLNARYGDGWHYEIAERRRNGDEVIVLCKLIIDEDEVTKTQFGSAHIRSTEDATRAFGTANGVSFGVDVATTGKGSAAATTEDAAYKLAIADALSKCIALL